jgi:branched-chain amino acid aminotransferase
VSPAPPETAAATTRRFALLPDGPIEVPLPPGVEGMHAALAELPNGVYSGLRSFSGGRFLALDEHVARAERSARALGFELGGERQALLRGLQRVVDAAAPCELKLRFDVLPQAFALGGVSARTWLASSPFAPVPRRFVERGVRVEVAEELVRATPLVKTTDFVLRRRPYPLESERAYEHLLVDREGHILECSSSNMYAVAGGTLVTAGSGVLEGITRGIVLRLARDAGLALELRAPRLDEVGEWDEAFLSSSTRGLVPVIDVAGARVGAGSPGPWTRRLIDDYERFAEREAVRALPRGP